ncbi:unnamed protein product [Discosporangium mesarthrocarpum]
MAGGVAGAASFYLYEDGGADGDMAPFQVFVVAAAIISSAGFWWTGTRLDLNRLESFSSTGTRHMPFLPPLPQQSIGDRGWGGAPPPPFRGALESVGGDQRTPPEGGGGSCPSSARGAGGQGVGTGMGIGPGRGGWGVESGNEDLSFWGFAMQLAVHDSFWLYVAMNFVENFNALYDQSFFVFLNHKLMAQVMPARARVVLTSLSLYLPKARAGS